MFVNFFNILHSRNLTIFFQGREREKKTGEGRTRKREDVERRREIKEEGVEGEGGEGEERAEGEGGEGEEGGV